jgi:hypothetical protein
MANSKDINKENAPGKKEEKDNPEIRGKKAIEADKKINKQNKSEAQIGRRRKKDAEQWRNEG